jgi:hypothetical protein
MIATKCPVALSQNAHACCCCRVQVGPLHTMDTRDFLASSAGGCVAWYDRVTTGQCRLLVREVWVGREGGGGVEQEIMVCDPGWGIQGMQWSPDGRRLLILETEYHGPSARFHVWNRPAGGLGARGAALPHGYMVRGATHTPTQELQRSYYPFFGQYSQSMRLWSPYSDAFCFAAEMEAAGKSVCIASCCRPAHH